MRIRTALAVFNSNLDDFAPHVLGIAEFLQNGEKQLPLQCWQDLRNDDDKAGVQLLVCVEFSEVARVVHHEGEIF